MYGDIRDAKQVFESMAHRVESINRVNGWYDSERAVEADIALLHSEVSEAFEAYRNHDKENFAEEMADVLIRLLDTCSRQKVDLVSEFHKKCDKNANRPYRHGGKAL